MKKIFLFLLIFSICGCTVQKQFENTSSSHIETNQEGILISTQKDSSNKEKELNNLISIYKDSLIYVKGLLENSTNITPDSSHLETTYAISDAKILSNGTLWHNLFNKDTIPSKIIIKYIKEKHESSKENSVKEEKDTSSFNNQNIQDTQIKQEVTIKEKNHFWKYVKVFFFGIIFTLISELIFYIYKKLRI